MSAQHTPCPVCGDSGWAPNKDENGKRIWLPFMNDALPCSCGALAKRYAEQKAAIAKATGGAT